MRGAFVDQGGLFSYIAPEARVPANHPLRKIRELVRDVLGLRCPSCARRGYAREALLEDIGRVEPLVGRKQRLQCLPAVEREVLLALAIENDSDLRSKRDLLLSISGVGDTLAGVVLAELPGPDVLHSSGEVVAYAGLNPRQHQSGTSVDRATRISKIGNAVLRAALYMPALSAMRYNPAIVALITRLKSRGRLKPKQIVVAAMRKLLVLCFGVLKTGKPFDPAIAMGC